MDPTKETKTEKVAHSGTNRTVKAIIGAIFVFVITF
jgi:hypothetical protein